ncbi:MAG: 5-keto-L-gluconate epimerase [Chloroflexota bacterium]|nr:5-keto-L-gluconate epimerase [Chloroflexota bacterium]
MKLSIVLSAQPTHFEAVAFKGDFERNLAHVATLGYDGAELAIRSPASMDYETIIALLNRYGLNVPAIGTGQAWGEEHLSFTDPDPAVRQAAVERVWAHVPFAAQAGAQIVIGLLRGVVQPGVSHAQAMAWLVETLCQCTEAATSASVRLCLEPLNRYETDLIHTVAEGLELLERVGADNLGLLLDTFHMNIEEQDMAGAIRAAGERLFHFHVADSNRWYPGAGHINFGHLLAVLDDIGYTGYVSGEFMPLPDADTAAERAIVHLRSVTPS